MAGTAVTKPKAGWKLTLSEQMPVIAEGMPSHVDSNRFELIARSAISSSSYLLSCLKDNPRSVWSSIMAAGQDGLLLDGRESALVPFRSSKDGWTCQYIPMIGGILKMMRQSGKVSSLSAHVVYENDDFDYELGDQERIEHKPILTGPRGKPVLAYAILHTTDGGIYREVMSAEEILKVKAISKAKNGPWSGPFETEMWRKTVLRRLAKKAPLSTDVINLMKRDDGMYDLPGKSIATKERAEFDMLTGEVSEVEDAEFTETGPDEAEAAQSDNKAPTAKPETEAKTKAEAQGAVLAMPDPHGFNDKELGHWVSDFVKAYNGFNKKGRAAFVEKNNAAITWIENTRPEEVMQPIYDALNSPAADE